MQVRLSILLVFFCLSGISQNYFQQQTDYKINVTLDDVNHFLRGYEEITYQNNSNTTLSEIWIHLWPNAYKNNSTAFAKQEARNDNTRFQFASADKRGFIDSLDFKVDGLPVALVYHPEHIDVAKIVLNTPLQPGSSVKITTPFRVKIPSSEFSRLGHIGQQYQICQWYPKPAVFDKNGWHAMPYLNQGEFYSEFGSYEVHITTDENYVIAATGELQKNPEEEARISAIIKSTDEKLKNGFPTETTPAPSGKRKTVVYKQNNVHDFAWFADKTYNIIISEAVLPSGKTVDLYAYFNDANAKIWKKSGEFLRDAVEFYSRNVGEYPYNVCKAVDGALSAGGGMEYPTITIVNSTLNAEMLDQVITHEVGHNWFYGILASNERSYPWMDEGTNSYYEKRYLLEKYPSGAYLGIPGGSIGRIVTGGLSIRELHHRMATFQHRRNDHQAANLHADDFVSMNYGLIVYEYTAQLFYYLEEYLGREKFDAMMKAWYNEWKFKHPGPEDFKAHAEMFTGENLSWWFDDLLGSNKVLDYKILKRKDKNGVSWVKVRNTGDLAAPVSISGIKNDTIIRTWSPGFKGVRKIDFPSGKFDSYSLNYKGISPDVRPKNDLLRGNGIFKRSGQFAIRFGSGLENPGKDKIFLLPALGANQYNGFMAGAILHNIGIHRKNAEFLIMPMYSSKNGQLAGSAQFDYFIHPRNAFFKSITLSGSAERYGMGIAPNFERFTGGFTLTLPTNAKKPRVTRELIVKHISVNYTPYSFSVNQIQPRVKRDYNQLQFIFDDARAIKAYGAKLDVQQSKTFVKASATIHHFFHYNSAKKGIYIRLFAGSFLWKSADYASGPDARFRLAGQTGSQDYLFDDIFFGRNESSGIWSRQMTLTDGAFKVPTFRGQTSDYLVALNLKSTIPGKIPLRLYADIGHYFNGEGNIDPIHYDAGVALVIFPEVFEVYFPLLISNQIYNSLKLVNQNSFGDRIRFVLDVRKLNPVKKLRTARI